MTISGQNDHTYRGDTVVSLTSPSGMLSTILPCRFGDFSIEGYTNWPFMSVHFWGENPAGVWRLQVEHTYDGSIAISDMSMTLYGTASTPEAVSRIPLHLRFSLCLWLCCCWPRVL